MNLRSVEERGQQQNDTSYVITCELIYKSKSTDA